MRHDRGNSTASPARPPLVRGLARGVVAAMAMSGARQLAAGLGVVRWTPPEAIVRERVPALLRRVPKNRRVAAIELAHWSYGGAAGALFAAVPARLRDRWLTGPLYGVLTWLFFELCVAPVLDLSYARQSRPQERVALFADHVLYGLVVAAPPVGAPAVEDHDRGRDA